MHEACSGWELVNLRPTKLGLSGVLVYYVMPGSQGPAVLSVTGPGACELTFLTDWSQALGKTGTRGLQTSDASREQGRWRSGREAQEAAGGAERPAGSKAAGAPPGLVCSRE